MDRATGLTLPHLNIELNQAESGNVTKMPHVPSVVPATSLPTATAQPNGAPAPQQGEVPGTSTAPPPNTPSQPTP